MRIKIEQMIDGIDKISKIQNLACESHDKVSSAILCMWEKTANDFLFLWVYELILMRIKYQPFKIIH
jgi:hypothetical protein